MSEGDSVVRFIRKGGKVIPIRAARAARLGRVAQIPLRGAQTVAAAKGIKKLNHDITKKPNIKPNQFLNAAGTAVAVGSGVVSGALFGGGARGFLAGTAASLGLDFGSTALTIAAHAGKGHMKTRAKMAAKEEFKNVIIGNAAYGATILAVPRSRAKLMEYVGKISAFGRKALKLG